MRTEKAVHIVWMGTVWIRRLGLDNVPKWDRSVQLRSFPGRHVINRLQVIVSIIGLPTPALWPKFGVECSYGQVFLERDAIPAIFGEWDMRWRNLHIILMMLADQIFKEGVNVHCTHPSL
jgi:hypothetical protein